MQIPDLYPHQEKAVSELRDGSILCGGVGTGKSRTSLKYYTLFHNQKDIYVITTAKKRDSKDWEGEAAKFTIGNTRESTAQGVLTVDSWNNIKKYTDVKDAFFIFDEQRLVGSGSWVKSFLAIAKSNSWILLSATPGDTWMDYIPVFLANGFYKNRTEFKREHVVYSSYSKYPKVERYLGAGKLVRLRNQITVEMPYNKHTTRHICKHDVNYDQPAYESVMKKRWNPYTEEPLKNAAELFSTARRATNDHPNRLFHIWQLMEKYGRLIVFYNFDYELVQLRGLANEYEVREWNGHKHEDIPNTEKWVYLVQYLSGAEGWNCIATNHIAFYSLTYSYRQFEQAQGRIDRLNTPFTDLHMHVFMSKSPLDRVIWRALSTKKDFNEGDFTTLMRSVV